MRDRLAVLDHGHPCRQIIRPISPWESLVIHQVSRAISLALKPAFADRRKMTLFRAACLVWAK